MATVRPSCGMCDCVGHVLMKVVLCASSLCRSRRETRTSCHPTCLTTKLAAPTAEYSGPLMCPLNERMKPEGCSKLAACLLFVFEQTCQGPFICCMNRAAPCEGGSFQFARFCGWPPILSFKSKFQCPNVFKSFSALSGQPCGGATCEAAAARPVALPRVRGHSILASSTSFYCHWKTLNVSLGSPARCFLV